MATETDETIDLAIADARYVLEWLRQTKSPPLIIQLQERVVRVLARS